ncbi:hypothetical protein PROFUN_15099, partial [Planoprotostelium fungivorum]
VSYYPSIIPTDDTNSNNTDMSKKKVISWGNYSIGHNSARFKGNRASLGDLIVPNCEVKTSEARASLSGPLNRSPSSAALSPSITGSPSISGSSYLSRLRKVIFLDDIIAENPPGPNRVIDEDTYKDILTNTNEPLVAAYTMKFMMVQVKN